MIISVLTDNNPGVFTPAEHGLSYIIEYDGKRFLFDTGQSDMFLKNAEAMKINMTNIDMIITLRASANNINAMIKRGFACCPFNLTKEWANTENREVKKEEGNG